MAHKRTKSLVKRRRTKNSRFSKRLSSVTKQYRKKMLHGGSKPKKYRSRSRSRSRRFRRKMHGGEQIETSDSLKNAIDQLTQSLQENLKHCAAPEQSTQSAGGGAPLFFGGHYLNKLKSQYSSK